MCSEHFTTLVENSAEKYVLLSSDGIMSRCGRYGYIRLILVCPSSLV